MIHPASTFHQAAESAILRQTATANACVGRDAAAQAAYTQHLRERAEWCAQQDAEEAKKLPIALLCADPDFEVVDGPLARLMREIADEACRVDIECHARFVGDGANGPVYDTNQLEPGHIDDPEMVAADKRAIERAVQYLDLRGILHRPVAGYPSLVCFARA